MADVGNNLLPLLEGAARSTLQESTGFGDSKWDRVPETEMLGHRPNEHGTWPETREMGVADCFL